MQNFYLLLGFLLLIMAMLASRKKENLTQDQIFSGNITEAYISLWKIVKTKNVMIVGAWYSTAIIFIYFGYSSIVFTRIQQNGVPRDSLALLDIPIICVKIISPILIVKLMLRDKILDIYRYTYFLQIVFCFLGAGIVYLSSTDICEEDLERSGGKTFPTWYYGLIFVYQSANYGLLASWYRCSADGFINRIVDHRIAGTYSGFKNVGPTTSIWYFLEIFRIIFGRKIEIFKIALLARPSGSFYQAILKISIFRPKIILKIFKNNQISETEQNF